MPSYSHVSDEVAEVLPSRTRCRFGQNSAIAAVWNGGSGEGTCRQDAPSHAHVSVCGTFDCVRPPAITTSFRPRSYAMASEWRAGGRNEGETSTQSTPS